MFSAKRGVQKRAYTKEGGSGFRSVSCGCLQEDGEIAGFLNGIATSEPAFRDEFFTDISLHSSKGENVMLLGLDVLPEFRRQGLAGAIVKEYSKREKERGRKRLILTCLDGKVAMYEKFGFQDNGQANSNWGGELWHEMSMEL